MPLGNVVKGERLHSEWFAPYCGAQASLVNPANITLISYAALERAYNLSTIQVSEINQATAVATPSAEVRRRRTIVTLAIGLGMMAPGINATVVVAVLPSLTQDLGGLHLYRWVVAIYMLLCAAAMPIFGRLADSHGRRRTYFIALFLFLLGSAGAGVASSMYLLIFFRAIQGAGVGGLSVLAYTIIADLYSPVERAKVQGYLATAWTGTAIAGPFLSTVILKYASWRYGFYVNVPIGILVWILVKANYVDTHVPRRRQFDLVGAALLAVGIGGVLASMGEHWNLPILMISLLLLGFLILHERGLEDPVLPLDLIRRAAVALPACADLARSAAAYATITYFPLLVSLRSGGNATRAGLVLTPVFVGAFIGGLLGGHVARYFALRTFAQITLWSYFVATAIDAFGGPAILINISLFVLGIGMTAGSLAALLTVQGSVARSELGTATGILNLARYLGGALGVGLLGSLLAVKAPNLAVLNAVQSHEMLLSIRTIFIATAVVAFAGALTTLGFPSALRLRPVESQGHSAAANK